MEELQEDLSDCVARKVIILVEQSHAGSMVRAFAKSKTHQNVQIHYSHQDYAWKSQLTHHWSTADHMHTCTDQVQNVSLIC